MQTKFKYGCCTVRHTNLKSFEYLQSTYSINAMFLQALEAVKCQQIFILLWKELLHTRWGGSFGVQSKLKTHSVCVVLFLCSTLSLLWLKSRLKSQHSPQRWENCLCDLVFYVLSWRENRNFFPFFNGKLFCKQNHVNKKLCFLFGEKNYKEWLLVTPVKIPLAATIHQIWWKW